MSTCQLRLKQTCSQVQLQTLAQKLQLKQLLNATLFHADLPNSVKGLEGMKIADKILKERNARGVLIGGLAGAIWNKETTLGELDAHKDVDVYVLDMAVARSPSLQRTRKLNRWTESQKAADQADR